MSGNADADDEYEHWPAQYSQVMQPAMPAHGYNTHNGLRAHTYQPAGTTPASPNKPQPMIQPQYFQPPQFNPMPMPNGLAPYPGFPSYSFYQPGAAVHCPPGATAFDYAHLPHPYATPVTYGMPSYGAQVPEYNYIGRTKAEVDEDNMKIAAREGAYEKRKIAPVNVPDDQMLWCVELDGSHTLRQFSTFKELEGEWKQDPRYPDSYYFVRSESDKDVPSK